MKIPFLSLVFLTFAPACSPPSASHVKEAWDAANVPELLNLKGSSAAAAYVYEWQQLPLEGQLQTRPWSDDYWPTSKGGISYRWNDETAPDDEARYAYEVTPVGALAVQDLVRLSPAEKLDLFMGYPNYPNTMSERFRTKILQTVPGHIEYKENFTIPAWVGLCHAWAPASLLFKEPKSVSLENAQGLQIPFGASDVKALLTYHLHRQRGKSTMLGARCNANFADIYQQVYDGKITFEEYTAKKSTAACRDTNAGSFHVVLSNQIARLNEGFIADVTRDHEVWNHPVYRYVSKVHAETEGASPEAAPGTVKEITVETTMYYAGEVMQHWDVEADTAIENSRTYDYRLELDSAGRIIGGAWLEEERPDFLWKPATPKFQDAESKAIKLIYETSIGAS